MTTITWRRAALAVLAGLLLVFSTAGSCEAGGDGPGNTQGY